MFLFDHTVCGATRRALAVQAHRMQALADDLRRIAGGGAPTEDDLRGAPMLRGWRFDRRVALCLVGHGIGHPLLGTRPIVTSDAWVVDPGNGWARTASRFYLLGEQADDAEAYDA